MTTAALPPQANSVLKSSFGLIWDNLRTPEYWTDLVPTIGAIAIGIIFAPNFALGLAIGAALNIPPVAIFISLYALGFIRISNNLQKELPKDPKVDVISRTPAFRVLELTLLSPILEEVIFRGVLQPLTTRSILWLVPSTAAAFMGTSLSIAFAVSVIATSVLFGAIHLTNDHSHTYFQSINATFSGIIYGCLAAHYGLAASIAAHIAANTSLAFFRKKHI